MRTTLLLTYCAIQLLLLASCDGGMQSKFKADNNITFDTVQLSRQHQLQQDSITPTGQVDVNVVYPVAMSKTADSDSILTTVQHIFIRSLFGVSYDEFDELPVATQKYVDNYILNYKSDAEMYDQTAEEIAEYTAENPDLHLDENLSAPFYSFHERLTDSIVFNEYDILSFQVVQSTSKGLQTYYTTYKNVVIDLTTGSLLTEADIFVPGYDVALRSIIQRQLISDLNVSSLSELAEVGYFGVEEMGANANFLVTRKGITYTFNQGEYSAYQLPHIQVDLSFNQIRDILKPNTTVAHLANK